MNDGIRMVLVGPHEGKDITLGGFTFKQGALILPPRGSGHAQRLLSRYYSAYPEGSLEGQAAQRAWEREQRRASGSAAALVPAADAHATQRLEEARAALEAERAEVEEELARTRAELRAAREAQRAAEAKLATAAQETKAQAAPQTPPTEEPPKGSKASRAKAQAE